MPKRKIRSRKMKNRGPKPSRPAKQFPTLEAALEAAESAMTELDADKAEEALLAALKIDDKCALAYDLLLELLIETERYADAKECFNKLIEKHPEGTPSSYMSLGHVHQGMDAVVYFEKAYSLLNSYLADKDNLSEETLEELQTNMVASLIAAVDIYMTDLCEEPEAEEKCEMLLSRAYEIDSSNVDTINSLVSFRLSQNRPDDAEAPLVNTVNSWINNEGDDLPPVATRQASAKLLLELHQHALAARVLEKLLLEEQQMADLWYFMAIASYHLKDKETTSICLEKAALILKRFGDEAATLKDACRSLAKEVETMDDHGLAGEEEEWEDIEGEDMDNEEC